MEENKKEVERKNIKRKVGNDREKDRQRGIECLYN